MQYRTLGNTGLKVSELGMGTWPLAGPLELSGIPFGYGETPEAQALKTIKDALAAGVTLFDTADFYGLGKAEYLLGEALAEHPEALIVTKAGYVPDAHKGVLIDLSRDHLFAALRRSLKRLNRDAVDVFLVHVAPVDEASWKGVRQALLEIKASGLARHTGISIAAAFDKVAPYLDDPLIEVIEVYYNLFFTAFKHTIYTQAYQRNLGILIASPFGRGLLADTTNVQHRYPQNDVRRDWTLDSSKFKDDIDRRAIAENICVTNGYSLGDAALSYPLALEGVSSVIPGMRRPEHVATNATHFKRGHVPANVLRSIEQAIG